MRLELLVLDADVVGPREQLRVRALHVVALVERVDHDLPVRGEDRRLIRAEAHLLEVVAVEQLRDRVEEVEQRGRRRVGVDEDEATPALRPHLTEAETVGQAGELVTVDDLDQLTVERVLPRVVAAANLTAREVADARRQPRAAMQAVVVEGLDREIVAPHDEDRLVADRVLK